MAWIQYCCDEVDGYSSDLTPSPATSVCHGCRPKKKKNLQIVEEFIFPLINIALNHYQVIPKDVDWARNVPKGIKLEEMRRVQGDFFISPRLVE